MSKSAAPTTGIAATQNPLQTAGNLASGLSAKRAAHMHRVSSERYGEVVVLGNVHFTEEGIRKVLAATGIAEDRVRAWEERPQGDTRNSPAR